MTKYEPAVFFNQNEAGEWINLLSNEGASNLLDRLAEDGYLDFDGECYDEKPWGLDDWLYRVDDYVVSVNYRLGYLAITRVVEDN